MEEVFKIVDCHRLVAVEDYQIVAVALMVAEEEIFAVLGAIGVPIATCNLNSWSLGVFVPRVADVMLSEPIEYLLSSFHTTKVAKLLERSIAKVDFLC